jgi:predicted small secreted protein
MRKAILLFVGFSLAALSTSCQTVQGMGRDLGQAGENIEKAATR